MILDFRGGKRVGKSGLLGGVRDRRNWVVWMIVLHIQHIFLGAKSGFPCCFSSLTI